MKQREILEVWFDDRQVGTLAMTDRHLAAFEYSSQWIENGFSISPLSLPLRSGVFLPKSYEPFEGLFGVFADSLPDGWGRLLVDRMLKEQGIEPQSLNVLTRLAIVGNSGMGALEYRPSQELKNSVRSADLDELAAACRAVLSNQDSKDLDLLFKLGGSSGGARPKVNLEIDGQEWIVKFPAGFDPENIGQMEFDYMDCAQECGLIVPEHRLLDSRQNRGYFAVSRFDRTEQKKVHMISAAGLLETSHRLPNLDYEHLFKLVSLLCRDQKELWKLYRLMCFNVFAHNRDDHSKNFSFLYQNGRWHLSPAYDLTLSNSMYGEHATTVSGNGKNPGLKELLEIAEKFGLPKKKAVSIAQEIDQIVKENLGPWLQEDLTSL